MLKREIVDGKMLCPECGVMKDVSEFGMRKHGMPRTRCRSCNAKRMREYFKNHPDAWEKRKKQSREYYWKVPYSMWDDERKQKHKGYRDRYIKRDPEAEKRRRAANRRQIKIDFINHYGGKCACCGETAFEFLTIEHKNGGGRQQRKKVNTEHLLHKLRKAGWPDTGEYEVLCMNCNHAKGSFGYCPHKR